MRQPPWLFSPWPGVTMPGQFGPTRREFEFLRADFTFIMSMTGMPSVMQTMSSTPASMASRMASAANGGGTKMAEAVAPVSLTAWKTVSKMGTVPENFCPPLPGVTPATSLLP